MIHICSTLFDKPAVSCPFDGILINPFWSFAQTHHRRRMLVLQSFAVWSSHFFDSQGIEALVMLHLHKPNGMMQVHHGEKHERAEDQLQHHWHMQYYNISIHQVYSMTHQLLYQYIRFYSMTHQLFSFLQQVFLVLALAVDSVQFSTGTDSSYTPIGQVTQ